MIEKPIGSNPVALKKVQTKQQVIALIQTHWQELSSLGVERCGIFGSFAREIDIREESDVDILVAFDPEKKTFRNFMSLAFRLEELFGRDVDLVTIKSLSPYIGPHILAEVEYVSTN